MSISSFDALSRTLASGSSRRSLLRGLSGAAVGVMLAGRGTVAAPQSKVGICHLDDEGVYHYLEVNGNAVRAHEAHGDAIWPDFRSDPDHCGGCGITCGSGYTCEDGGCVEVDSQPVVCTDAVLASAFGADTGFFVDDDLEVFVNGTPVFGDNDEASTDIGPIALGSLTNGDSLQVVASNSTYGVYCTEGYEHLDAITLYCPSRATSQTINPSDIFGQPAGGCGHVFFDETFTVAL